MIEQFGRIGQASSARHLYSVTLAIFRGLAVDDPSVLRQSVHLDFPNDVTHVRRLLEHAGFEIRHLWEGVVSFEYSTAAQALEHLLKSGAGTAYYEAVDPVRRHTLGQAFVNELSERTRDEAVVRVDHEYIACIGVAS
ncbi:MAG: hypothetical protein GY809_16740 [Planctomycetes bacterium]|nr:hypothetical protein [Planctomycetota bacterium]